MSAKTELLNGLCRFSCKREVNRVRTSWIDPISFRVSFLPTKYNFCTFGFAGFDVAPDSFVLRFGNLKGNNINPDFASVSTQMKSVCLPQGQRMPFRRNPKKQHVLQPSLEEFP